MEMLKGGSDPKSDKYIAVVNGRQRGLRMPKIKSWAAFFLLLFSPAPKDYLPFACLSAL